MIYLAGWAGMFFSSFFVSRKLGRRLVYVLLLFLMFVSFFRGMVGTDTANYISIFKNIAIQEPVGFSEIGFIYLSKVLLTLTPDPELAVKSVSVVFYLLLGLFFYRSDENESFLFVSYLLPVFAYSYSMNGLRIGVAFSVFLVLYQCVSRAEAGKKGLLYLFAPSFFHISMVVLPFLFFFYRERVTAFKTFSLFFLSLVFLLFFLFFYNEYLLIKMDLYGGYRSPSVFSGARVVVPLLIILFGCAVGGLPSHKKDKLIFVSLFLICSALVFTRVSYAGLRALDMLSFVVPIAILWSYQEAGILFGRNMKATFFVAGLISALATYRGYVGEEATGSSPFLPYAFSFL